MNIYALVLLVEEVNKKRKPEHPKKKKTALKSKQPSILQFFNLAQRPSS
ncbi:hypothetical protein L917_16984 [Phytophthora nicotianae]|uniref:Uncharacterized protein n=1 Tax=Phytophthora nicotianae TaxID=4792 RepID=W2KEG7_PHYNI|nr:hypothetical protein L917_16984 [Phytophthora nicotianae]